MKLSNRLVLAFSVAVVALCAACGTHTPTVKAPAAPSMSVSGYDSGIANRINGEWIVDQDWIDSLNLYLREGWGNAFSPPFVAFASSPRPAPVLLNGMLAPPGNYYAVRDLAVDRKGEIEIWRGLGKKPPVGPSP